MAQPRGDSHQRGEAGLENFTISLPDQASVNALATQLGSSVTVRDKEGFTIVDPDGIEIVVRREEWLGDLSPVRCKDRTYGRPTIARMVRALRSEDG